MIRTWVAIAILAASWLPGLGYYRGADWRVWALMVAVGTVLLVGSIPRKPGRWQAAAAVVLLLPAIVVWPWPYRAAPVLLAAGLALAALPIPRGWPKRIGGAAVVAGVVLLAQGLGFYAYETLTARSHDLPWPLPHVLGVMAGLLGQDSAVSGSALSLHSMRMVHRIGATWELLLDGPTCGFLIGGIAYLFLWGGRRRPWRRAAVLAAVTLIWLPVRAGLLAALYLHRVLVTDYDSPLAVMNQFWSTPVHLVLLAVPVLLAWRFVSPRVGAAAESPPAVGAKPSWRRSGGVVVFACAVAVLAAAVLWDPVGDRKAGRVFVEEGHSTWEPTTRPMDTQWYGHDSGYNYACMYDYLGRFYEMSRLTDPISDTALWDCDVLMLKTPTSAYGPEEIEAIHRFVSRGGGLLLVGEHTNVFHTGEHLNSVARKFGFAFRYDCLFGIDWFFDQLYELPLVPHPIVRHMPPLDFSVSCSIAPGTSAGRAVIRAAGLKNALADYHASNFYPRAEDRPDMRYGAFVQLWASRYGQGRVVAFGDSTIFSNFSLFEPAKAELILGMVEWANHRDALGNPRPWLAAVSIILGAFGLYLVRGWSGGWMWLLVAGMLGHAVCAAGIREYNRRAMPLPEAVRPYVLVTIDRTASEVILSKGGFIAGREDGFAIFERWILRLGYFTRRADGPDAAGGNLVVVLNPSRDAAREHVIALADYVKNGGHLLVLDSAKNAKSTANSLLWPFEMAVDHGTDLAGQVTGPSGWPAIDVDAACEVAGGRALARVGGKPVAATVRWGEGSVTVIGFSHRFSDRNMGVTGDIEPDETMRSVYEFEFKLLRAIVEGQLPAAPASP